MLSIEQHEAVFAAALRVAEKLVGEGHDEKGAVRGAEAVVAAAKAAHVQIVERVPIARVGSDSIELLVDRVPIGTCLYAGPKQAELRSALWSDFNDLSPRGAP